MSTKCKNRQDNDLSTTASREQRSRSSKRCFVSAKQNPFSVSQTTELPFDFQNTKFQNHSELIAHLKQANFRGSILGRKGSGKTTLLKELPRSLEVIGIGSALVFIPRDKCSQQNAVAEALRLGSKGRGSKGKVLLVDGLERLPFLQRLVFLFRSKKARGLIATTHWRSVLPTLVRCKTSDKLLLDLLRGLKLDQPDIVASALTLWPTKRGNIRLILRELYDQYSTGKFG